MNNPVNQNINAPTMSQERQTITSSQYSPAIATSGYQQYPTTYSSPINPSLYPSHPETYSTGYDTQSTHIYSSQLSTPPTSSSQPNSTMNFATNQFLQQQQQQQPQKLDQRQIPNPIYVRSQDQETFNSSGYYTSSNQSLPMSTTNCVYIDDCGIIIFNIYYFRNLKSFIYPLDS